jgi:hypothetical protein
MTSGDRRLLACVAAVVLSAIAAGRAGNEQSAPEDPRLGLKAGLRDAGQAARGLQLVASLPKPKGFFDPKAPAGQRPSGNRRHLAATIPMTTGTQTGSATRPRLSARP